MTDQPKRKPNRLAQFDYSSPGAFFITICTKNKKCIFWKVGASSARPGSTTNLSKIGLTVKKKIAEIPIFYRDIKVENSVVMPNHVHLLLTHYYDDSRRAMLAPTTNISTVIQQFKGAVTKEVGFSVWQKSFHDRIIRNEKEFIKLYEYIENNPYIWEGDSLYIKT